jgi:thiol-disulfide isomerase/thioredoxin
LFFGTWCHDSEREVPRLLKLLETAGLSDEKLTLVGLDYRKRDPEGRAVQFDIRYTPTAIIMREGIEVGRIVERPKTSLREEIIDILDESGR